MRLIDRLRAPTIERAGLVELIPTWKTDLSESAQGFLGMVQGAYHSNGVVFACITARMRLFAEARFVFRRYSDGGIFTTDALAPLENPWSNGTGTELLARMIQDADVAGNAFIYRAAPNRLQRLRPDRVEIMSNGREVIGYLYWPNGVNNGSSIGILPNEMAHWAPIPDPEANWKGMSWLRPVIPEIRSDQKMSRHQEKFYDNAATPNMLVKVEGRMTDDSRKRMREELERRFSGIENAYKTLVLDGGADAQLVGRDFQQLDFSNVRGGGEARIAMAAGVPPIVIGLKAGLDAATYSNYGQALKAFGHNIRPLWNSVVAALSSVIDVPAGAELWFDIDDIAALRDDAIQESQVQSTLAATIRTYLDAGFTPESSVAAVAAQDPTLLQHTGLFSVQLQEPGQPEPEPQVEELADVAQD